MGKKNKNKNKYNEIKETSHQNIEKTGNINTLHHETKNITNNSPHDTNQNNGFVEQIISQTTYLAPAVVIPAIEYDKLKKDITERDITIRSLNQEIQTLQATTTKNLLIIRELQNANNNYKKK